MTNYLLGTRALKDFIVGDHPDSRAVRDWADQVRDEDTFFAAEISIGQLLAGIERIPSPATRARLEAKVREKLKEGFEDCIYPFDITAVERWALIAAQPPDDVDPLTTEEAQVIATALVNGCTYVGRRSRAHEALDLDMEDPWSDMA